MITTTAVASRKNQRGMTLFAVMAVMAIFAMALLAVAPTVQQDVQREKELEAIQRGEEVAEAIRQYVEFYRGAKLPNSMDDLLNGLPRGSTNRAILRAEAAVDPLSEDGHWRLIKADVASLGGFARSVQMYSGGTLPPNTSGTFDRYSLVLVNSLNTQLDSDIAPADDDFEVETDNTPFIGVASQSKSASVIAYYGIENHSRWIFTPLFRGTGPRTVVPGTVRQVQPNPQNGNPVR